MFVILFGIIFSVFGEANMDHRDKTYSNQLWQMYDFLSVHTHIFQTMVPKSVEPTVC